MGLLSQEGHVGIRKQAVKGTYATPGAAAPNQGVFFRIRSGALGGDRELLIPDPEIGGNRDIPGAALGPIAFSGEYEFYARMEAMASLLYGALGAVTTTGTLPAPGTGYAHAITPASTIPWYSIEENIAGTFDTFGYKDAKFNTLHLEADADGYLTGTVGIIALSQDGTISPTAAGSRRNDVSPLLVGTNIIVNLGGVQLPAKSFSIDINNNLEDDDFRLGSLFLGDLTEKRREVNMSVTIRPQDADLWKQATWGSSSATGPQGQPTYDDVEIIIESYEDIPTAAANSKYKCVFDITEAVLAPFTVDPSGDDVLEHDIEITAVRPDPGTPLITATVTNSFVTVA